MASLARLREGIEVAESRGDFDTAKIFKDELERLTAPQRAREARQQELEDELAVLREKENVEILKFPDDLLLKLKLLASLKPFKEVVKPACPMFKNISVKLVTVAKPK